MKRHAPATARNSKAIAGVLKQELPETGRVLEIASGTGEHAVFFASRFSKLEWQPSDLDPEALASIDAYAEEAGLANLMPSVTLDASEGELGVEDVDAVLCINMVHISPWEATVGLFEAASKGLAKGAPLILYGPYIEDDVETAPSNIAFDESLSARNPLWGLRELGAVDCVAERCAFKRSARHEMPANNLTLVYRRA